MSVNTFILTINWICYENICIFSKSEKEESPVEKGTEKIKAQDTPKSKLFKSASGTIDVKKSEKNSAKKIAHRRNSLPRCTPSNKSDSQTPVKGIFHHL